MTTTRSRKPFMLWFLISLTMSACLSSSEKQERRQDAYDISGVYSITSKSDGLQMNFEIKNRNDVRSDIEIYLNRSGALTDSEKRLLAKYGLDESLLLDFIMDPNLLFYSPQPFSGGNNISRDNGKTTEFFSCTTKNLVYHEVAGYQRASIEYCFDGVVTRKTQLMAGQLILNLTLVRPRENNKEFSDTDYDFAKLSFSTPFQKGFASQYIGDWTGQLYGTQDQYLSQIIGVQFEKINESIFVVYPLYLVVSPADEDHVRKDSIVFEKENYRFSSVNENLDELSQSEYPMVRIVYVNESNTKRLVFIGTIWSLGNYSGNVVLIKNGIEEKVGSFQFSKN